MLVIFHHCHKMPEQIHLKEEKFYAGSQFLRFQCMASWLHGFGPEARQNIMVEECDGVELLISWQPGNKERQKRVQGQRHVLSDLLPPTRSHLLRVHPSIQL
jgi:hypothetical protein